MNKKANDSNNKIIDVIDKKIDETKLYTKAKIINDDCVNSALIDLLDIKDNIIPATKKFKSWAKKVDLAKETKRYCDILTDGLALFLKELIK